MKKLFTAIRQGKLDEVAAILDKKPELIACLAKAPPKKDDGQSPLMVAIKSDHLEAAHLLLDRGADVTSRTRSIPTAPTSPPPSGTTPSSSASCGRGIMCPRSAWGGHPRFHTAQ